jgi:pimeloyl-ACP methyl ester carboxylesterase
MPSLELQDVELRYIQTGTGPDILWVPGGDECAEAWTSQFEAFGREFRNTSMDPRGAGQTRVHKPPPWTIADMAADCAALVKARCEPPVVIIGLSMGSLVALQFAIDYPELARLAIPMGTLAKATGFSRDWMIAEVNFRRSGGRLPADFAITHYAAFSYPAEVLGNDELWAKIRDRVDATYSDRDADMLTAQWDACINFDVVDELPNCHVPIDVIGFSQDCQAPAPLGRRVSQLAPNSRFHLLEGLGHLSCGFDKSEVVNQKILEILDSHGIKAG